MHNGKKFHSGKILLHNAQWESGVVKVAPMSDRCLPCVTTPTFLSFPMIAAPHNDDDVRWLWYIWAFC